MLREVALVDSKRRDYNLEASASDIILESQYEISS